MCHITAILRCHQLTPSTPHADVALLVLFSHRKSICGPRASRHFRYFLNPDAGTLGHALIIGGSVPIYVTVLRMLCICPICNNLPIGYSVDLSSIAMPISSFVTSKQGAIFICHHHKAKHLS
jgi:hypothetical protein